MARWSLLTGQEKELLTVNHSSIREPVTESDYDSMVAVQSCTLAKLSHEIVDAIHVAS